MRWIDLAEKTVLIKSILTSFPIYISAMFLAPKAIINSIPIELNFFLLQGGKTQGKKFHLLNWATIKEDKAKGGLGLRDPFLKNKVLGSKFVWRLISRRNNWWK